MDEQRPNWVDRVESVDWYVEFSASEFGNPDLIADIHCTDGHRVIFFEAKLKSYEKAASSMDTTVPFEPNENNEYPDGIYKNKSSSINAQLALRYRLAQRLNNLQWLEIRSSDEPRIEETFEDAVFYHDMFNAIREVHTGRRIHNRKMIEILDKITANRPDFYFVAMTFESQDHIFQSIQEHSPNLLPPIGLAKWNCVCVTPAACVLSDSECQSSNQRYDQLYCKCIDKIGKYSAGDLIQFGHYEQDNDESNGKEPITWRVLEVKSDRLLVMSEMIIDAILFNYSGVVQDYIAWEGSDIRDWLNGYISIYKQDPLGADTRPNFYDSAFNATEKELILTTTVLPHAGHQGDGVDQGKETNDKLFLLSMYEHRKYFNGDHCIAYITSYGNRQKSSSLNCISN